MSDVVTVLPDGRVELATPVALPDVLDMLIVGAGPAGTAAAFRAKELGLTALVIEIDDVMKRIRDYDEAKPIKPDFGAGRQMGFPKAGELIERLHFFTDVKGRDLCRRWKQLYRDHSVPVQLGVELIGLEPDEGGRWRALVRNEQTETDGTLRARHVVLALGAGMPRRLDVPGDVRAIADRLAGADRYVGAPACVIGAGVSALEAVIAISAAKVAAADKTAVYWSHRGEQMPRVPRALAPALAQATEVHGNVRLLPVSEAREVADTDDGKVLRIQVGRRDTPGAPVETTQVEFEAGRVIACIGQEIDWSLLNGIGIYQVTGGARSKKAIPLNALLESRQPNVHVIGDTLNIAYLECDDFDGDASTFAEVKHRGNIKASLADGVKVTEVIAQRLTGNAEIRVELEFVGGSAPASPAPPGAGEATMLATARDPTRQTPPTPPGVPGPPPAVLMRLLGRDVEAEQFVLFADHDTSIGRRECDIRFEEDTRLADRHATVQPDGDGYVVRDDSTGEGVFLHLTDGSGRAVTPGTVGRVGAQWVVFGTPDAPLLLVHHDARGRRVAQHRLQYGTQILGRAAPDITLAADDMSLSRRHASVVVTGGRVYVRDLNSANGTFLKVDGATRLDDGDILRLGHQALRFGLVGAMVRSEVLNVDTGRLRRSDVAAGPVPAEGLVVVFHNRGQTCPFKTGQTICDVAESGGVAMKADCHKGICGSDPVRVVSGQEHLDPMTEEERDTLEDICAVDPADPPAGVPGTPHRAGDGRDRG